MATPGLETSARTRSNRLGSSDDQAVESADLRIREVGAFIPASVLPKPESSRIICRVNGHRGCTSEPGK